jgi:isopentenyl-diphosphate delta-isomerase
MSNTADDLVILVDENDTEVGFSYKLKAHQDGLLHRAISVFVHHKGALLLQQRALDKYHSAGLWSNTCCSHPRPGESISEAAHRRLQEEMNIDIELTYRGFFIYRSVYDNGLIEHELDHVFSGELKDKNAYRINPHEAQNARWVSVATLKKDLLTNPNCYTSWLHQALCLA